MKFLQIAVIIVFTALTSILGSCSRVSWASFTTPKDNIQNIPKALEFLKAASTNDFRIVEFDDKNYLAFFVDRGISIASSELEKNIKLIPPTKNATSQEIKGTITDIKSGIWNLIQYIPGQNEPDIITATYLMEAINKLKNNRKFEIYSQTHTSVPRSFIIIYK